MRSKNIVAAAIVSFTSAQSLDGYALSAMSLAADLASLVVNFDGSDSGIITSIQSQFQPFSSSVASIEFVASQAKPGDIEDVSILGNTLSAIAGLLDAFTAKFDDFDRASATNYVESDIQSLAVACGDIVSDLVSVLGKDQVSSVAPTVSELSSAFRSAGFAYNVPPPDFPDLSDAQGVSPSDSAASSAASSSAAADSSSAASSSAAASSGPAGSSSAAASSGTAASSVAPSSGATSSLAASSSVAASSDTATTSAAASSGTASSTSPASSAPGSASQSSASSSANGATVAWAGLAAAAAGALAFVI